MQMSDSETAGSVAAAIRRNAPLVLPHWLKLRQRIVRQVFVDHFDVHVDLDVLRRAADHVGYQSPALGEINERNIVRNFVLVGRVPSPVVGDVGKDRSFAAERYPLVFIRQAMRTVRLRREAKNFVA